MGERSLAWQRSLNSERKASERSLLLADNFLHKKNSQFFMNTMHQDSLTAKKAVDSYCFQHFYFFQQTKKNLRLFQGI